MVGAENKQIFLCKYNKTEESAEQTCWAWVCSSYAQTAVGFSY